VIVTKQILQMAAGWLNRVRLGFPGRVWQGAGGIGDELMCTTVFHELRKRGERRIVLATRRPELFRGNADLDAVVYHAEPRLDRWLREGLPYFRLGYGHYDQVTDKDDAPSEHVLAALCRLAGVMGKIALRPYLSLTADERAEGRVADRQIVMQSSGLAAAHAMRNKEWGRFQAVCEALRDENPVVQIGSAADPKLEGAIDLRGKTSVRESAALLANASVFIGLVGFLMHLARAVDCRGVIVYGGRETPELTGYSANVNVTGNPSCSPCWQRSRCDYEHVCMKMIEPETVIAAAKAQLGKKGQPLEVEVVDLTD
jgi:ADP-heptose:LPS heptosyltransferase